MSANLSTEDQLRQLNDARKLVLSDVKYYQTIVQGVLPIIGNAAKLELRRWGINFLAEAFSTPAVASAERETMQLFVLDHLRALVEDRDQDPVVLAQAVLVASSIYPLALRWNINNSYDESSWQKMTTIKSRILDMWSPAAIIPVRISCIKFAQRVILAQTNASAEMRHGTGLEVSLDKVPEDHLTLDKRMLEGEAIGLLDRMLGGLQENSSDALLVDATLNCLSILARTRAGTANRIVNAVLSFNPLRLASSPITAKTRVLIRSMEKTTRLLLIHLVKRDPQNPHNHRIQQHVEKLVRAKTDLLDTDSRKRMIDELSSQEAVDPKRLRVGGAVLAQQQPQPQQPPPQQQQQSQSQQRSQQLPAGSVQIQITVPPLQPGPHSLAEIFTLAKYRPLATFDASVVPMRVAARVSVAALELIDVELLNTAVDGIRARLAAMSSAPAPELNPNTAPLGVEEDDDDDYEPNFFMAEDTEQILNRLDSENLDRRENHNSVDPTKPFVLPRPPPMTAEEQLELCKESIDRVFKFIATLPESAASRRAPAGGGAGGTLSDDGHHHRRRDREWWIRLVARICCRTRTALDVAVKSSLLKAEMGEGEEDGTMGIHHGYAFADHLRARLYQYVMDNFRFRIDSAIDWMYEEFRAEWTARRRGVAVPVPNNQYWALRLLDGFLPYLNAQDKFLTRFLAEIPVTTREMVSRLRQMCRDPSVVPLALNSLLYLIVFKPPVKEASLDVMEEIWAEFDDAKTLAGKYLQKYRPAFLENAKKEEADRIKEEAERKTEEAERIKEEAERKMEEEERTEAEMTITPNDEQMGGGGGDDGDDGDGDDAAPEPE